MMTGTSDIDHTREHDRDAAGHHITLQLKDADA